mgnify:CR=1 FL=1
MKILYTNRLMLRPLELYDAEPMYQLIQHRDVAMTLLNIMYPYSQDAALDFIHYAHRQTRSGEALYWAILQDDVFMGVIGLTMRPQHNGAEIGYWLGVPYWGMGYATEAARRILQYAFGELKLHRIHAVCFADNIASVRVLEKIGLQHEGTLRHHYLHWGVYKDAAYFGILNEDNHE